MRRNPVETVMGAVVLLVAGFFLVFAYNTADVRAVRGYDVEAVFTKVGGLEVGADVRISGIKIGSVVGQRLDPDTFDAVVRLSILPDVRLPKDTRASITGDGLLGGKFVTLTPGTEAEVIPEGGVIAHTEDFKSLEEMVGEIIFLATQDPEARRGN